MPSMRGNNEIGQCSQSSIGRRAQRTTTDAMWFKSWRTELPAAAAWSTSEMTRWTPYSNIVRKTHNSPKKISVCNSYATINRPGVVCGTHSSGKCTHYFK